jgi:Predicted permease
MNYKQIDKLIFKYILVITGLIILFIKLDTVLAVLTTIIKSFSNIFFAAMLAYVVNIIMSRIEKLLEKTKHPTIIKLKRALSLILSLILIFFIFYSLINLVVPEFLKAVSVLTNVLPTYFEQLKDFLTKVFADIPNISNAIENLSIDWQSVISNVLSFAGNGIGSVIDTTFNVVTMVTNSLFNFLLIFIFSIYILVDKERFKRLYYRLTKLYLKESQQKKLNQSLLIIHQSFSSFIGGQCIEATILGSLCALGMMILRMPYALMIGTLVGTINIIPVVGAYIGGAIGVFMVFTVSPKQALVFLIYLCILQQIESQIIYPRVVGNSVGLPGIYVAASVMVFGTLAGIPGMFLGIPIVASVYKLARIYIQNKEKQLEKAHQSTS